MVVNWLKINWKLFLLSLQDLSRTSIKQKRINWRRKHVWKCFPITLKRKKLSYKSAFVIFRVISVFINTHFIIYFIYTYRELSLKEAMWLKQQGETTTTVDRLTAMQDEIQSLK